MLSLNQPFRWLPSRPKSTPAQREPWGLDRNWDRAEGERQLKSRDFATAERYLTKAVAEAEVKGQSASKRIHLRLELAEAQRKQFLTDPEKPNPDKLEEAELTVRAAIELAAKTSDQGAYVQCLDSLASIFEDQGNYPAVEKVILDAIHIEEALPHPDPIRIARRNHDLGLARHKNGRSEEAVEALENAVAVHEQNYGPEHLETAALLSELGEVYRAQGKHADAQRCLKRALRVHENHYGIESADAIHDLHNLAGSMEDSGDLEGAAAQYERVLALKHRSVGGNLEQLAEMQFGLAGLYIGWQNYSRARELLLETVGSFRRAGGPRLAVTYETLAHVEEASGRYHDAVKFLAQAGKVWESLKAERRTELMHNLEYRIDLLDQLRKKHEASWLRDRLAELHAEIAAEEAAALEEAPLTDIGPAQTAEAS